MTKELWIGDYSVLIWIPKDADIAKEREIIRKTINEAIALYGLKVVNA
jgi:hypothetical protein